MSKKVIIGSRGSKLALLYAQQAKNKIIENTNLGNDDILIKSITTKGDEVQNIRLSVVGGKGLWSDVWLACDSVIRNAVDSDGNPDHHIFIEGFDRNEDGSYAVVTGS